MPRTSFAKHLGFPSVTDPEPGYLTITFMWFMMMAVRAQIVGEKRKLLEITVCVALAIGVMADVENDVKGSRYRGVLSNYM